MEYINILRLDKARQMLDCHAALTVEAIAGECGLSARSFYRLFRERYGITPTEYRKTVKQE
ncbi:MAG: helix-turn-helix domain-containing protein [Tannerellaceae bacterium]|nr:helix-turn-helix domain-containing protein [Tannerellaceae bacterium]